MHIGVPKETKVHEYRVGLTPSSVAELVDQGHQVTVQKDASIAIGFDNDMYVSVGARIGTLEDAWSADLIVKVKEPNPTECSYLREGQTIFTYLHLAVDRSQAEALLDSGATAIAYETVTSPIGGLPLLMPMSAIAGRMSIQVGAHALERASGGRGVLLGGVLDVPPAHVVIIGGGIAGTNAAQMALGLGARVTIVERNSKRVEQLPNEFDAPIDVAPSETEVITGLVEEADLVIGAILIPGATAPRVVSRSDIERMPDGAAIVDISIDQGGCFETSHPTTHDHPMFIVDGVVHYCVTNMPGAVARTATLALNDATLPFVQKIADLGWKKALQSDPHFADGLNIHAGSIYHPAVAVSLGCPSIDIELLDAA